MTDPTLDLATGVLRIHIIGIGGIGMRPIASVLASMGHRVSGSDMKPSAGLERLTAQGVEVQVGHDPAHVESVDVVVVSTAIPGSNPEVRAARAAGTLVVHRAEALAAITRVRRTLAVSGTHGKTTTTTMLAMILQEAGLSPSFIIGGDVNTLGSGAAWDDGDLFVVEADESDGTFTELDTEVAVVTNIEADHLDHWGDLPAIEAAFDQFARAVSTSIVCVDEPHAAALAARRDSLTYGTSPDADFRIVDVEVDRVGTSFGLEHDGEHLGVVEMPIPGLHNARNATAALVAAQVVGAPFAAAQAALAHYAGVARRYQFRGTADGITLVDDYAHNPGKVAAVVGTAALGGWGRVIAVFQPHRYSRTEDLGADFAHSFVGADRVLVMAIDGAGEAPRPGITGQLVVDAVRGAHPDLPITYVDDRDAVLDLLVAELTDGDLCLTLGAGDVTGLPDEVLARLIPDGPA